MKVERAYLLKKANTPQRIHVSDAGNDWELLVDGSMLYDTKAKTDGGGTVDLLMHLCGVSFNKAVRMISEARV